MTGSQGLWVELFIGLGWDRTSGPWPNHQWAVDPIHKAQPSPHPIEGWAMGPHASPFLCIPIVLAFRIMLIDISILISYIYSECVYNLYICQESTSTGAFCTVCESIGGSVLPNLAHVTLSYWTKVSVKIVWNFFSHPEPTKPEPKRLLSSTQRKRSSCFQRLQGKREERRTSKI